MQSVIVVVHAIPVLKCKGYLMVPYFFVHWYVRMYTPAMYTYTLIDSFYFVPLCYATVHRMKYV